MCWIKIFYQPCGWYEFTLSPDGCINKPLDRGPCHDVLGILERDETCGECPNCWGRAQGTTPDENSQTTVSKETEIEKSGDRKVIGRIMLVGEAELAISDEADDRSKEGIAESSTVRSPNVEGKPSQDVQIIDDDQEDSDNDIVFISSREADNSSSNTSLKRSRSVSKGEWGIDLEKSRWSFSNIRRGSSPDIRIGKKRKL